MMLVEVGLGFFHPAPPSIAQGGPPFRLPRHPSRRSYAVQILARRRYDSVTCRIYHHWRISQMVRSPYYEYTSARNDHHIHRATYTANVCLYAEPSRYLGIPT